MSRTIHCRLVHCGLVLWLVLFSALPAVAQEEPALLNVLIKGRSLEQASASLIQAIGNNNFTFVRQQDIASHLVPTDWDVKSVRIIYFCNFNMMRLTLALDTRTTEFLPCRVTLIETARGVEVMAVNPA